MNVKKYIQQIAFITIVLALLLAMFVHGKSKPEVFVPDAITLKSRYFKDIVYKTTAESDSLKLDVYMPATATPKKNPVVVFIHGGGWTDGSKNAIQTYYRQYVLDELLRNGYTVFSINYRLVDKKVHFPSPIEDCKDAIKWIRKNAELYHIDTGNIGIWGASAGGHLALITAYSYDDDFQGSSDLQAYSAKVNYVIDNFAPTDLNQLLKPETSDILLELFKIYSKEKYRKRTEKLTWITGIENDKSKIIQICEQFSPINYVSSQSVPTLLLHGNADETVPLKQSILLCKKLKDNNVQHKLVIYKNAVHGFKNVHLETIEEIVETTVSFIKQQTHKPQ